MWVRMILQLCEKVRKSQWKYYFFKTPAGKNIFQLGWNYLQLKNGSSRQNGVSNTVWLFGLGNHQIFSVKIFGSRHDKSGLSIVNEISEYISQIQSVRSQSNTVKVYYILMIKEASEYIRLSWFYDVPLRG